MKLHTSTPSHPIIQARCEAAHEYLRIRENMLKHTNKLQERVDIATSGVVRFIRDHGNAQGSDAHTLQPDCQCNAKIVRSTRFSVGNK